MIQAREGPARQGRQRDREQTEGVRVATSYAPPMIPGIDSINGPVNATQRPMSQGQEQRAR